MTLQEWADKYGRGLMEPCGWHGVMEQCGYKVIAIQPGAPGYVELFTLSDYRFADFFGGAVWMFARK